MLVSSDTVTVEIIVERYDSRWIPFDYRMTWCKQRTEGVREYARETVELLGVLGGIQGEKTMRIGERRHYRIKMTMETYRDYWGEFDSRITHHTTKRIR